MHRVIVVGVDGSAGGYPAVAEAAEIAKRFNADLLALSVEEGMPKVPTLMDEVDEFKRKKDRYFAEVALKPNALRANMEQSYRTKSGLETPLSKSSGSSTRWTLTWLSSVTRGTAGWLS